MHSVRANAMQCENKFSVYYNSFSTPFYDYKLPYQEKKQPVLPEVSHPNVRGLLDKCVMFGLSFLLYFI